MTKSLTYTETRHIIYIYIYISRGGGELGCHISRMRGVGMMFMARRLGIKKEAAENKH